MKIIFLCLTILLANCITDFSKTNKEAQIEIISSSLNTEISIGDESQSVDTLIHTNQIKNQNLQINNQNIVTILSKPLKQNINNQDNIRHSVTNKIQALPSVQQIAAFIALVTSDITAQQALVENFIGQILTIMAGVQGQSPLFNELLTILQGQYGRVQTNIVSVIAILTDAQADPDITGLFSFDFTAIQGTFAQILAGQGSIEQNLNALLTELQTLFSIDKVLSLKDNAQLQLLETLLETEQAAVATQITSIQAIISQIIATYIPLPDASVASIPTEPQTDPPTDPENETPSDTSNDTTTVTPAPTNDIITSPSDETNQTPQQQPVEDPQSQTQPQDSTEPTPRPTDTDNPEQVSKWASTIVVSAISVLALIIMG